MANNDRFIKYNWGNCKKGQLKSVSSDHTAKLLPLWKSGISESYDVLLSLLLELYYF